MRFLEDGSVRYNRHDRKKGCQPPELTCWHCKTDMGITGVYVYGSPFMAGRIEPGLGPGQVDLRVIKSSRRLVVIECQECAAVQDQLVLGDWFPEDPEILALFTEAIDEEDALVS